MAWNWGDRRFVEYLAKNLYDPRSSAHGDALCSFVLEDIIQHCAQFRRSVVSDNLVYARNYTVQIDRFSSWNIDLVVGPRDDRQTLLVTDSLAEVPKGEPREVWLAIDAKGIMTEHGKARRNRIRDLESMHNLLHRRDPMIVVGVVVVINIADTFKSPLRSEITHHKNIQRIVEETVRMFETLPKSANAGKEGLEGLSLVVVRHTNVEGDATELLTAPPAPAPRTPLYYQNFIQDICLAFEQHRAKRPRSSI